MMAFFRGACLAAGAFMALVLGAPGTPATAVPIMRPADAAGGHDAGASLAQFRFPWLSERKPARRAKSRRAAKPSARKPGQARQARPERERRGRPPPLPPPAPAANTEADDRRIWAALAAAAPPPRRPAERPALLAAYAIAAFTVRAAPAVEAAQATGRAAAQEAAKPAKPAPPIPTPRDPPAAVAHEDRSSVPLPPSRDVGAAALTPPDEDAPPEREAGPSEPDVALPELAFDQDADCKALGEDGQAVFTKAEPIEGPGVCGARGPVALDGVKLPDGATVAIKPAATLRCATARAVAAYVRETLAPAAVRAGSPLVEIATAGSFQCRGRNGAAGGKMSEHGRANAIDLLSLKLEDGRTFPIFAPDMPQAIAEAAKAGACELFDTVLGPGSDGAHETHLHLDLQPRRSKAKLCQWDEPAVAGEAGEEDDDRREAADRRKAGAGEDDKDAAEKPEPPPVPKKRPAP